MHWASFKVCQKSIDDTQYNLNDAFCLKMDITSNWNASSRSPWLYWKYFYFYKSIKAPIFSLLIYKQRSTKGYFLQVIFKALKYKLAGGLVTKSQSYKTLCSITRTLIYKIGKIFSIRILKSIDPFATNGQIYFYFIPHIR